MKVFAAYVLVLNVLHIFVAVIAATSTGFENIPIYSFTLPHVGLVFLALVLLVYCVASSRITVAALGITGIALAATSVTALYAMSKWPGGNDGPGIAWSFVVGGLSVVNTLAALVFVLSAARRWSTK